MADESPTSNNAPIWVAVITVVGSLLSALVVNADKWMPRGEKSAFAATTAAAPPVQPGPAAPQASAPAALQTPAGNSSAAAPTEPAAPAQREDAAVSSGGADSSATRLEANAADTFRQYFAAWSNPGDPDGRTVSQFYGPSVTFYGKELSRLEVMGEKLRFARRWPSRSYAIRPNSIRTECSQETGACKVFGKVDWRASSDARSSYSSGSATFLLVLNDGVIVGENGRVLSRD